MKIDSYSFGRIVINGKVYTADVIIYPGRVDGSWWRKEGHRLFPDDLADVIKERPDILVIGRGYSGVMSVPEETIRSIRTQGIDVKVERTSKAVDLYNALAKDGKKVIAALHITC